MISWVLKFKASWFFMSALLLLLLLLLLSLLLFHLHLMFYPSSSIMPGNHGRHSFCNWIHVRVVLRADRPFCKLFHKRRPFHNHYRGGNTCSPDAHRSHNRHTAYNSCKTCTGWHSWRSILFRFFCRKFPIYPISGTIASLTSQKRQEGRIEEKETSLKARFRFTLWPWASRFLFKYEEKGSKKYFFGGGWLFLLLFYIKCLEYFLQEGGWVITKN